MSREIKFRAWDGQEEEMLCNEAIFGNELCVLSGHQDEDFIFMQYTGLKDKNGVEIYESDIIDVGYEKGVIVWHQLDAMFAYAPLTISIEAQNRGKTAYQVVLDGGSPVELDFVREYMTNKDCSRGEVIGNIYENENLLKE